MDDLIARLEKATGPDRELDASIYALLGNPPQKFWGITDFKMWSDGPSVFWSGGTVSQGPVYLNGDDEIPSYTKSVDVALTLVPPHYLWEVKQGIEARAIVWRLDRDYDEGGHDVPTGYSTTFPAIALCIAALKARAAE